MAMSTARAEATLAVLEAERAQLEHRLKKVRPREEKGISVRRKCRRGRIALEKQRANIGGGCYSMRWLYFYFAL